MSIGERFAPVEARTLPRVALDAEAQTATSAAEVTGAAKLAAIGAAHAGSEDEWRGRLSRDVDATDRDLLVAVVGGEVVGYARLSMVQSEDPAPDGVYLVGLIVAPTHRRRGVAEALVRLAAQSAARRASFYDLENGVSAALHAALGFREVARGDIGFPGLGSESQDVLVRLALPST